MASFKRILAAIYNYTHIFVGAGAVVTSFLDTQALPPKWAAGIVIASQALKVASNVLVEGKTAAPLAEKLLTAAVTQAESAAHPAVLAAPLEPATPASAPGAGAFIPQP